MQRKQALPKRKPFDLETARLVGAMRQRLGLTLQECADYLGVPLVTLVKWENGTRTPGSAARRLFEVLGVVEIVAPKVHENLLPPVKARRRSMHNRGLRPPFPHKPESGLNP